MGPCEVDFPGGNPDFFSWDDIGLSSFGDAAPNIAAANTTSTMHMPGHKHASTPQHAHTHEPADGTTTTRELPEVCAPGHFEIEQEIELTLPTIAAPGRRYDDESPPGSPAEAGDRGDAFGRMTRAGADSPPPSHVKIEPGMKIEPVTTEPEGKIDDWSRLPMPETFFDEQKNKKTKDFKKEIEALYSLLRPQAEPTRSKPENYVFVKHKPHGVRRALRDEVRSRTGRPVRGTTIIALVTAMQQPGVKRKQINVCPLPTCGKRAWTVNCKNCRPIMRHQGLRRNKVDVVQGVVYR